MWVTLYTDASWYPDEDEPSGGWGFWAKSSEGRITLSGSCPGWVGCNNSAEIAAVVIGIQTIFETWNNDIEGILVCTDSTVALEYLRFRPNGTKTLKRKDWLKIRKHVHKLLDEKECKVKFRHVKGHQSKNRSTPAWLNNKVDEFSRKFRS
jgi:ribonuclease HI